MEKSIFTLLNLIFCFTFSVSIFAQGFNSITTPDGVNLIAVGNSGKLYRSANGGTTWASNTNGILNMNCAASNNNDVWIAANNGTIYKTQKTFSSINTYSVGSSTNLNSITFIDANTGYVCGDGGAVYKSTNGGVNWSSSNSGISSIKLNSVAFRDANNGTVVGDNGTIYATNDGSSSWTYQISGTTRNILKVKYFSDSLVAVGEYGILLLNSGSGWTGVVTRTNTDIRGITGTNMSDIHVCGGGGFIRNNKSGSSKFLNFEMNPMLANLVDIYYYDFNNGWAVSSLNSVIIYTTNAGANWIMPTGATVSFNWVSKPGASGNFLGNNICMHPTNKNIVFVAFGNQVYRSLDRGENWSAVGNTIPSSNTPHSFYISPADTNIWLIATEASPDRVFRTTNYGQNWTQVLSLPFSSYGEPLENDQNNPHVFYFAPDGGGFYKSTDDGATFSEISGNYAFRSPCEIIVTWDSSNIIILGDGTTGSGRAVIFKSSNTGVNWTPVDTVSSDGSETPSMCNTVFDRSLTWCTEWVGSDIYKSTDYGSNFFLHHSAGVSGWGSDICREDPTVVITGSWGAAATLSTNEGANWSAISLGLSGHGGGILIEDRGYILAQQGSNIYKLNITYTDVPVLNNIDVQALSIVNFGIQYYQTATINPSGIVKNNNGGATATFTVTRRITPGGYVSTETVTNLAPSGSTSVTFDPWTFNSGTTYAIKDSVSISGDTNPGNDVLSGSITPYVGETIVKLSEGFTGAYPPTGWTFQFNGTNYWMYNAVSSYGIGTGSDEYDFWNAPANTGSQSMFTPIFTSTISGDSLQYDYAYAPFTSRTDSLIIETSTNGGTSYTTLVRLRGKASDTIGVGNTLKTAPTTGSQFTPNAKQWLTKKWGLPVGTNKIKFRARSGFGNDLFLDSIRVLRNSLYTQLNIKVVPEGLYNGSTANLKDTITAYLRSTLSPFNRIDSAKTIIDSVSLNASCVFEHAPTGTYYIHIKHRNSIETWSKLGGESFTHGITSSYDFTSSQGQSYGNNSVFVGSVYCIYSGDINQDGIVDVSDIGGTYNDAINNIFGYTATDINGDYFVDVSDLSIVFNNSSLTIAKNTPEVVNDIFMKQKIEQKNREFNSSRKNDYKK